MEPAPIRVEIAPNCSLSPSGGLLVFASLCFASLIVAVPLAIQGYWPILPFAGAELSLLGWALWSSLQRRHHGQTITVSEASVCIESRHGARTAQVVFPRHWARVKLRRPFSRLHPSRLTIESHGRQCEVGSFLTEEERRGLALRLERLIGRVNEAPALA